MEPFKRNFNRIITGDDVNDTIEESRKFLSKTKKPVKFTWKGAADLLVTMSNTPLRNYQLSTLMDKSLPRVTDLAQGKDKPQEKDYIDFFEDMEKSIFGGAQNIGYSFGDIITTGIDMGAAAIGKETNLTERLTEVYEEIK